MAELTGWNLLAAKVAMLPGMSESSFALAALHPGGIEDRNEQAKTTLNAFLAESVGDSNALGAEPIADVRYRMIGEGIVKGYFFAVPAETLSAEERKRVEVALSPLA